MRVSLGDARDLQAAVCDPVAPRGPCDSSPAR